MVGTNRLMIMFDAKNMQLKQWTVTDPQGLDTTVAVYNLDTGKKPDPNLFVINYQHQLAGRRFRPCRHAEVERGAIPISRAPR